MIKVIYFAEIIGFLQEASGRTQCTERDPKNAHIFGEEEEQQNE